MKTQLIRLSLAVALLIGISATASAAPVSWGPAQQVTGDSDVLNAGATNRAYLFAADPGPDHTINGVTFSQFNQSAGTDTETFTNAFTGSFGSASSPYASLSGEYQVLLGSAFYSFGTTADITLTGLTVGTLYDVQVWMNDSCANADVAQQTVSGSPALNANTTGMAGGLGQFLIGSFVADASQQTLTFTPQNSANASIYLNGLQLRTVVPEPASLVLSAIGVIGLTYWRRNRLA